MDERFIELAHQLKEYCQQEGIEMMLCAGKAVEGCYSDRLCIPGKYATCPDGENGLCYFYTGKGFDVKDMLVAVMYKSKLMYDLTGAAVKERAIGFLSLMGI